MIRHEIERAASLTDPEQIRREAASWEAKRSDAARRALEAMARIEMAAYAMAKEDLYTALAVLEIYDRKLKKPPTLDS